MSRIYVGNLPIDVRESEVDDLFYKYGRIRDIDLKTPARPPAFAFVNFEDSRDAEDAVRGRDGYSFDGSRLRVEFAKGDRDRGGRDRDRGGRFDDRRGGRDGRDRGRGPARRSEYSVTITNLPNGSSWQDLKDFMRSAGDVLYANIERNGDGIVEFANRDDMDYAVKNLDDKEFKNRNLDETKYIRVRHTDGNRGDARSRSRSRSRSPSKSRSRSRDRSRSRSRDRSRSRSRDKSRSRSRS